MANGLFYHLGRKVGPKVRKARWVWESMTGTEADAIRLEHGVGLDLAQEARHQLDLDPDAETRRALDDIGMFFSRIPTAADVGMLSKGRVSQVHAIEHMDRLSDYLRPPAVLGRVEKTDSLLHEPLETARRILELSEAGLEVSATTEFQPEVAFWPVQVETMSLELSEIHRRARPVILKKTAGEGAPMLALQTLDAIRWLDRVGYHTWRISNYLGGDGAAEPTASSSTAPSRK